MTPAATVIPLAATQRRPVPGLAELDESSRNQVALAQGLLKRRE
jgi:hypothetical protein